MKKIFSFAAILLFSIAANAQKTSITVVELPANAQTFLKNHFPNEKPTLIIKDNEIFSTDYKVHFASRVEVEFDAKGELEEVDGKQQAIPAGIVPAKIASYVETHFKDSPVTKLDKSRSGYEINLSNGVELEFNLNGKFLRIDN